MLKSLLRLMKYFEPIVRFVSSMRYILHSTHCLDPLLLKTYPIITSPSPGIGVLEIPYPSYIDMRLEETALRGAEDPDPLEYY